MKFQFVVFLKSNRTIAARAIRISFEISSWIVFSDETCILVRLTLIRSIDEEAIFTILFAV